MVFVYGSGMCWQGGNIGMYVELVVVVCRCGCMTDQRRALDELGGLLACRQRAGV